MQTDIYYRGITRTENLENYLKERVESVLGDFLKNDSGAYLTVRVEQDRRRSQTRKPSYMCEVIVKPSWSKGIIKVQKTDEDFKACVNKTAAALRTVVAKRWGRKAEHGRYDPFLERRFQNWSEAEESPSAIA